MLIFALYGTCCAFLELYCKLYMVFPPLKLVMQKLYIALFWMVDDESAAIFIFYCLARAVLLFKIFCTLLVPLFHKLRWFSH